jgi:hypothetical protein
MSINFLCELNTNMKAFFSSKKSEREMEIREEASLIGVTLLPHNYHGLLP